MLLPRSVKKVLVWHRGALGDVLLSGPALTALAAHYPEACFTLLGAPSRLALLAANLPVAAIWDSQRADWAHLFMPETRLPERLLKLLADFDLAVIFSPQPRPQIAARLQEAGIRAVRWLPTFPSQEQVHVSRFQARHLKEWGINPMPGPFRLIMTPEARVGDYVLVHTGYAIAVLDPEEAEASLAAFAELAAIQETLERGELPPHGGQEKDPAA